MCHALKFKKGKKILHFQSLKALSVVFFFNILLLLLLSNSGKSLDSPVSLCTNSISRYGARQPACSAPRSRAQTCHDAGTARGHVCPRRRKACRRNNRSKCKKSPVVKCLQGGDPRGRRRTRPRVQSPAPRGGIKFPPRHRGCSGTGCTHGMRRSDDELPLRPVLARPLGSPVRLQRSRPRPLRPGWKLRPHPER